MHKCSTLKMLFRFILPGLILSIIPTSPAAAKTSNGNDLALEFSSAKSAKLQEQIKEDAIGRPHFFRYLRIENMKKGEKDGRPYVEIAALEPSSYMNVYFVVTKKVSLKRLEDDPVTKQGDAIAVTGVIKSIDKKDSFIVLDPVIVRYKDRLYPKSGKELLYEVDPTAIYYSYTGAGKDKVVRLTWKDRDLIPWHEIADPNEQRKMEKETIKRFGGPEAWADYLLKELEKREKVRKAATDK